MLVIVISALAIIYMLTIYTGSGNKLSARATRIIRISLFILAPVLIALITISRYNIFPRGYWVTKAIFWSVIFMIMVLFGLGNRAALGKIERSIYKFFYFLPLAWIPFLLIPFFGFGVGIVFYVAFIGDESFIKYSDENIRIQKTGIRFLGPDSPLAIYVKDGLFAYKDTVFSTGYNAAKDSVHVRRLNDSTYFLIHYAPDNYQVPTGFEEYKFYINSTGNSLQQIIPKIDTVNTTLPSPIKIGDTIKLSGGYDYDPLYLKTPVASFRTGTVIQFIKGQNESPAAVVKLDQEISGEKITGDIVILELRLVGQTWKEPTPVHIELCDFMPENKPWKERRQGEWVEAAASVTLLTDR